MENNTYNIKAQIIEKDGLKYVKETARPFSPSDLILVIFFWGIILSFTIYCVTCLAGGYEESEQYYDNLSHKDMLFAEFNNTIYKNQKTLNRVAEFEYMLYYRTNDTNTIIGKNGYLFEIENNDGYNYLKDYLGESHYTDAQLEGIRMSIEVRQKAYENQGIHYILAVIPNNYTVCEEYLPLYLRSQKQDSRLMQLDQYLKDNGAECFINLTYALNEAGATQIYNNTEDSINAMGAWYIYKEIYNAVPFELLADSKFMKSNDFIIYRHSTAGRYLTSKNNLSGVVSNMTVSISGKSQFNYSSQNFYEDGMVTTYRNYGNDDINISFLLEFTNAWDKIELLPYFSNSFDSVTYKVGHDFSMLAIEHTDPQLVIQFIHEYELDKLTDSTCTMSYNAGLKPGENPFVTSAPFILDYEMISEQTYCIAGWAETDSTVYINIDGYPRLEITPVGNQFFATIPVSGSRMTVEMWSKAPGKTRSETEKETLYTMNYYTASDTIVEKNSFLYSGALNEHEFPTNEQFEQYSLKFENRMNTIRKLSGKHTEFISAVIPDKVTVYSDVESEQLKLKNKIFGQSRWLLKYFASKTSLFSIDLTTKILSSLDSIGENYIYMQTSDKLTDYGIFLVYSAIIEHINENNEEGFIRTYDDFVLSENRLAGGELLTAMGFNGMTVDDIYMEFIPKYSTDITKIQDLPGEFDITKSFMTVNDNSSLPAVIIMRDSLGTQLLDILSQHFSTMYVLEEGIKNVDDEILKLVKPDFIIDIEGENSFLVRKGLE